jgi:hypothetical protein
MTVGVGILRTDGGAMRRDQQSIQRPGAVQRRVHPSEQFGKSSGLHHAVRQRPRRKDRDGVELRFRQSLKETADLVMRIGPAAPHFIAFHERVLLEVRQRRGAGNEGVRFLKQSDDADAHGLFLSSQEQRHNNTWRRPIH